MGLPLKQMTADEFLAWEETQTDRHEFFKGETFAMTGGSFAHARVIINLTRRIDAHLDGAPCDVFSESMKLKFAVGEAYFYPDLMVTGDEAHKAEAQFVTAPKLIIEVLSPSTRGYDKREKFRLYRTHVPSLREYVLIDPIKREVEVHTAADEGKWLLDDQTMAGALTLKSLDLALPFEQVFKGVEPEGA